MESPAAPPPAPPPPAGYAGTQRVNDIHLGRFEQWALPRMARALPRRVTPDGLTWLALAAAASGGAAYWATRYGLGLLWAANVALVLHWWADSLDGTLARERDIRRERYGFYVDHQCDALSVLFVCAGLGASPLMRGGIALSLVLAVYLMMLMVAFVTITRGVFKISFAGVGPTEMRLGLIVANTVVWALGNPGFSVRGWPLTLFDGLGLVGTVWIGTTYAATSLLEWRRLAALDPPRDGEDG